MAEGWENHEPAPLEYFHGKLMDEFHKLRLLKGDNPEKTLTLNGIEMNNLIAKIKVEIYAKYPKQVSEKAIPKSDIKGNDIGIAYAMEIVTNELLKSKAEGSYYYSWQANIAMAILDQMVEEGLIIHGGRLYKHYHETINKGAKRFLDLLTHKPDANTRRTSHKIWLR